MSQHRCSLAALLLAAALAVASLPRSGWLDRVVNFQKQRFFNEVSELVPVNVKAQIRPKPEDFEDSGHWDYDAVVRLLALVRGSETGKALRRMLRPTGPTRRYKMSMKESMRWFPSIKKHSDDIYYDVDYTSSEEGGPYGPADAEKHMVVITNPVESRMPAAAISVDCLKRILEHRAHVLRQMPPRRQPWQQTKRKKKSKRPKQKRTTPSIGNTTADNQTTTEEAPSNNETESGGLPGNGTSSGNGTSNETQT